MQAVCFIHFGNFSHTMFTDKVEGGFLDLSQLLVSTTVLSKFLIVFSYCYVMLIKKNVIRLFNSWCFRHFDGKTFPSFFLVNRSIFKIYYSLMALGKNGKIFEPFGYLLIHVLYTLYWHRLHLLLTSLAPSTDIACLTYWISLSIYFI